jgi:membrane protein implicated in regulation of membrane protease activity
MVTFYFICLLVGLVFAVLSFIFSGFFEAHVDGGMDAGVHMDHAGDITGGDAGVGEVHFPSLSPIVIASFVTAFGGGGMVGLQLFPFLPVLSVAVATGAGVLVAFVVGFVVMKLYKALDSNAIQTVKALIGTLAEVTEGIPADGVGEISYQGKSGRASGPARSEEKKDIKRHAMVSITRVIGGLYYVREHVDEKLRDVAAEDEKKPG